MHFEIVHDFDIPFDAVELAVVSPGLVDKLAARLPHVESVRQTSYSLEGNRLERVWQFQANVPIPEFAERYVTREMCAWDEHTVYDLKTHASSWSIVPSARPEWRKYFEATGTYVLERASGERTRRIVRGELALRVPYLRPMGERMIASEVRKNFEAEAATLRDLATLV